MESCEAADISEEIRAACELLADEFGQGVLAGRMTSARWNAYMSWEQQFAKAGQCSRDNIRNEVRAIMRRRLGAKGPCEIR